MANTIIDLSKCIVQVSDALKPSYSCIVRDEKGTMGVITQSRQGRPVFVVLIGCSYYDKNIAFELEPFKDIGIAMNQSECRMIVEFDCMNPHVREKVCGGRFISLYDNANPFRNEKVSANDIIDYINLGMLLFFDI